MKVFIQNFLIAYNPRCADDKLKKMALRVIAESLSEEEIAGLKEAIPCDGHQQQRLDEVL